MSNWPRMSDIPKEGKGEILVACKDARYDDEEYIYHIATWNQVFVGNRGTTNIFVVKCNNVEEMPAAIEEDKKARLHLPQEAGAEATELKRLVERDDYLLDLFKKQKMFKKPMPDDAKSRASSTLRMEISDNNTIFFNKEDCFRVHALKPL